MFETGGLSFVERLDSLRDESRIGLKSEGDVAGEVNKGRVMVLLDLLRVAVAD